MVDKFQPRYVAYAVSCGMSPEAMIAHDRRAFPGGCGAGFILWVGQQWRTWAAETGWTGINKTSADHTAFDAWLAGRYMAEQSAA